MVVFLYYRDGCNVFLNQVGAFLDLSGLAWLRFTLGGTAHSLGGISAVQGASLPRLLVVRQRASSFRPSSGWGVRLTSFWRFGLCEIDDVRASHLLRDAGWLLDLGCWFFSISCALTALLIGSRVCLLLCGSGICPLSDRLDFWLLDDGWWFCLGSFGGG